MKRILRRRPSPATVIALTALVVALGGVAYATIPDSNGTIHACYRKGSGNLRVVESATECHSSESALAWNQEGRPETGSAKLRSNRAGPLPFGTFMTLFEAPLVKVSYKCEERQDQVPGTDLKTVTVVVENLQPSDPLRVRGPGGPPPYPFTEYTIGPNSSQTSVHIEEAPDFGAPLRPEHIEMYAFGANGGSAQGDGFLDVGASSCAVAGQTTWSVD
jgi:hypothetical protein